MRFIIVSQRKLKHVIQIYFNIMLDFFSEVFFLTFLFIGFLLAIVFLVIKCIKFLYKDLFNNEL